MARVLFFGAPIETPSPDLAPAIRFQQTGRNTGNTLIGQSLLRQLVTEHHTFGAQHDPAWVDENFDLIAIPASNFLFHRFDFSSYADFIERTHLPCLMVGLGAQAPMTRDAVLDIPEGTRRFIKLVAERTVAIGVRGYYTAEVMGLLGIKNVRVVGCPSFYMTLQPTLTIHKKDAQDSFEISLNGSRNVVEHASDQAKATEVERQLLEIAIRGGHDYVLQNGFPEIDILTSAPERPSDEIFGQVRAVVSRLGLQVSPEDYVKAIQTKARLFFDVDEWRAYIATKTFSLGTRFHGNIVALVSGVPACILTHDSRTTEMCEFLHIPHLPIDQVGRIDLHALYGALDFADFERRYVFLFDQYRQFLDDNGVQHRLPPRAALTPSVPDDLARLGGRVTGYRAASA